jgi:hypothetical protein
VHGADRGVLWRLPTRDLIQRVLGLTGFDVGSVAGGAQVMALFGKRQIRGVVVPRMPAPDGIALTRQARAPGFRHAGVKPMNGSGPIPRTLAREPVGDLSESATGNCR